MSERGLVAQPTIKERIAALSEAGADEEARAELQVAFNTMVRAQREALESPTVAAIAAKNAAREDLEATLGRIEARVLPGEAPVGERFKNRKAAWEWLQAEGYKVSRGKFYNDCAAGYPAVDRDGSVSRFQVLDYGLKQGGPPVAPDLNAMDQSARKTALEIERLELSNAKLKIEARELDRGWMRAEDGWTAIAALLGTLLDNLQHHLYEAAPLVVHLAGGDPARAPEVYEAVNQAVARAMNELGATIEGVFDPEGKDDE